MHSSVTLTCNTRKAVLHICLIGHNGYYFVKHPLNVSYVGQQCLLKCVKCTPFKKE